MNYAQTAQNLASKGRYGDSMLVHMTPQEVGGLQALARSHGTSMTINPTTGLPEAFSLRNLIPMAAGAALTVASGGTLSPLTIGLMTGGIGALATGSLKEGLMMGLGAAGGAGLAGSMANLAAPAAASTGAAGGAAGGTGLTTGVAIPPPAPASALSPGGLPPIDTSLTGGVTFPGTAGLQAQKAAISLDPLSSANLAPGASEIALPAQPSFVGLKPPPTVPLSDTIPSVSGTTLTGTAAPPSYMDRLSEGFGKATSSMESAGDYLSGNKMNLAMSAAPALMAGVPEPEPLPGQEQFIRPYSLEVDNLSGQSQYAPGSTQEREQLRYRYTPQPIYRAAQGGIVALAEGGESVTAPFSAEISPQAANVYRAIARTQGLAGLPMLDVEQFVVRSAPKPNRAQIERQIIDTAERNYNVYRPKAEDSESYKALMEKKRKAEEEATRQQEAASTFKRGGIAAFRKGREVRDQVRKPIDRMAEPYDFADFRSGKGLYDTAIKNFAEGGQPNTPRFLSGGGDGMSDSIPATIADKQPARLADGEFVIPADVVSHLGNGSSKAGAKQLYAMMDRIRKQRTGKKRQAPEVNPRKAMPA